MKLRAVGEAGDRCAAVPKQGTQQLDAVASHAKTSTASVPRRCLPIPRVLGAPSLAPSESPPPLNPTPGQRYMDLLALLPSLQLQRGLSDGLNHSRSVLQKYIK